MSKKHPKNSPKLSGFGFCLARKKEDPKNEVVTVLGLPHLTNLILMQILLKTTRLSSLRLTIGRAQ